MMSDPKTTKQSSQSAATGGALHTLNARVFIVASDAVVAFIYNL